MPSAKRRRGIGIKEWVVAALKERAAEGGCKSHTEVATKIWLGEASPLEKGCRKHKAEFPEGSKGVSMREEVWLALKVYADNREGDDSSQKVANMILVGKLPSLPHDCIVRGREWATERESERLNEAKSEGSNRSSKSKKKIEGEEPDHDKAAPEDIIEEERERSFGRRKRKLSQGSLPHYTDEERRERELTLDVEILGGVFNL